MTYGASGTRLHITGMAELKRKLADAGNRANPYLKSALAMCAEDVLKEAKNRVPIDTGTLRRSGMRTPVTKGVRGLEVTVAFGGPSIPYALSVHEYPEHAPYSWRNSQWGVMFTRGGPRRKGRKTLAGVGMIVKGHHFLSDPVKEMGRHLERYLAQKIGRSIERAMGRN